MLLSIIVVVKVIVLLFMNRFLKECLVKMDKLSLVSFKLFSEQVRVVVIVLYKELLYFIFRIIVCIGFNMMQKNLILVLDILLWQEKVQCNGICIK